MREIKFRFWNGFQMIKNEDINYIDFNNKFVTISDKWHDGIEQIDFDENKRLMQYTGYKDINGKEIYEGDIIEYEHHVVGKIKRTVRIKYGIWGIKGKQEHLQIPFANIFDAEFEVIGNIHENPELLEVK